MLALVVTSLKYHFVKREAGNFFKHLVSEKKCLSRRQSAWKLTAIYVGAGSRIRTDDLLITNQLLYQLSYAGKMRRTLMHADV